MKRAIIVHCWEGLPGYCWYPWAKNKLKNGIVAINSDNDPYVDLKHAEILKNNLDAEVIIKHNAGHFSGSIENETACLELPDVVESIEKMTGN